MRFTNPEENWIVIEDEHQQPRLVLNTTTFLRAVLMDPPPIDPRHFCREPLVITNPETRLEMVLENLNLRSRQPGGKALHPHLVLLRTPHEKRVLTGVDLLAVLLRGTSRRAEA
jgi:metal transporter CNNM